MIASDAEMRERLAREGQSALAEIFETHRERLRNLIRLRLDPRVQARVDASDIIQEAWVEAAARLGEYLERSSAPPFLWVRGLTAQKVLQAHRFHLGAERRDAAREVSIHAGGWPAVTSRALAFEIAGAATSPSEAASRAELCERLARALDSLEPIDREVLALRHFELLTNDEAARVLDLDKSAASKRYVRALRRLREALAACGIEDEADDRGS